MKTVFWILCLVIPVVLYGQTLMEVNFEKGLSDRGRALWKVNTSKDPGAVSVVKNAFEHRKQALLVKDLKQNSLAFYTAAVLPVKKGDTILLEFVFKSKKGEKISFGIRSSDGREEHIRTLAGYSSSWDRRTVTIQIREDSTKSVHGVLMAHRSKVPVAFSYISVKKLSPELATLYSRDKAVAHFKRLTRGNNLARQGKISFNPQPNYELTRSPGDAAELIDGKLSTMNAIWFDRKAVGFNKAYNGTSITVDLGKVCDVSKAVIRLQGGRIYSYTIAFPDVLEVWVSKDGVHYYQASALTKLKATESSMADWKTLYYLPETDHPNGIPYMYSFSLPVQAQARYVVFRAPVYQLRSMFSDELAVMEASAAEKKSEGWNGVYKRTPRFMNHNKIMIYPKLERFYVGEGIKLPNFLTVENQIDKPVGRFSYEFDLPAGVLFTHDKVWPAQLRVPMDSVRKGDRIIYRFRSSVALDKFLIYCRYGFGPFYFHVEKGTRIPPENSYVVFRTFYNDKEALAVRRELSVLKMPAIVPPKKLDISMWWEDRYMEAAHYPDSFRRSGFTTSMFFPRKVSDMTGRKALYSRMEKEKFKIRLELEPTNRMRFRYPNVTEFRCVGSEKKAGNICLAYRGKYYKESVDEIRQIMKQREVYAVTFDIENWEPHNMNASMRCSRCIALKEKKGYKSFVEYFEKEQASFVQGYAQAVRQGAREGGHKVPYIGFYAASPFFAYRCEEGPVSFLGYKYIFGKYCDEVQYSYYGRSSIECHKKMREVFRKSPFRARRIPWLTAGTGAYYSDPYSYRNEQHVVETLMNGAVGIQFYSRKSFESPLDYYYVAKGIGALSPYEDFLFNGTLEESLKGNNPNLCYTARRLGKEVLLLVGNYESRKPADSVICFPGKIRSVKFISGKGKASSKGANLAVNAGSDSFILVKVTLQ